MTCANCGSENAPGRRFCGECGRPLTVECPVCGAANDPVKFCGQCGSPLGGNVQPATASTLEAPTSERRLVSVLFADLVGFTTQSEQHDSDEVRDMLGRYFDTCRTLIARYGGTVEKFIGDAVMAVWGTPVAQEDDAERAVRTALDLVQAVAELGREVGWPDLRVRAGVLTGEASVTLGATGQGMVAGDLVNTASRIQAAAPAGSVFVGEATRRATEAAIAYEDAGLHELKGKAQAVPLWRALRVVAMRGGALRSEGLEAPFVGRDAELRAIKEMFHAAIDQAKAHMACVIGIAGIGKSRLSWEFYKYIDGLADTIRWHRGRCISYGEGVTYWALAEMVRGRAEIVEGEDPASARRKLRDTVERYVPDPEERAWVESRLAHLLALEERTAREPEDLFSAWRLFFERMAERDPVVLVFEDLQWADPSLLDFLDYLLNWSRNHRVFVMALARPEVNDRFPGWGSVRRGVTTQYLEPLSREDMETLLTGLVPGLPEAVREKVLARAEGVPLYAVETVRMLLDRGALVQDGPVYRPTGPIEDLEVPETLHALIAARLDGLPAEERAVLQDAAVLGKTFGAATLAAMAGRDKPSLEMTLKSLVRKEVLSVQADPLSPERGQYVFLQDLVRRVAYETLSRKDRKARHLAAAAILETSRPGEEAELAEVLAAHYLEANRAVPDAADAAEIKVKARDALARAAHRSESLAASREALAYYEQAADLTDDPTTKLQLLSHAGDMANGCGQLDRARALFDRALVIAQEQEDDLALARIEVGRSLMATADGRLDESLQRLLAARAILDRHEPGPELAQVLAEIGRLTFFLGRPEEALPSIEQCLPIAERLSLGRVLSNALNTKGLILRAQGRTQEGQGLIRHALRVALARGENQASQRAYNNLASIIGGEGNMEEELELAAAGLALARKVGETAWEAKFLGDRVAMYGFYGRWDEAVAAGEETATDPDAGLLQAILMERAWLVLVHTVRGDEDLARRELWEDILSQSEDIQAVSNLALGRAWIAFYAGRHQEAIDAGRVAIKTRTAIGFSGHVEAAYAVAGAAALAMDDLEEARGILEEMQAVPAGEATPYLMAQTALLAATVAARTGDDETAEREFARAVEGFRAIDTRFEIGVALAEQGRWLARLGRTEDAARSLDEARAIFEQLRATWWLGRLGEEAASRPGSAEVQPARA
jgi:class 3 adenylate cyclase/tetratricopeptide (TPR) repeat protein